LERVAVVTGGASGLGRSVCEHLASARCRVAVLDLDGAAAEDVAAGLRASGAQAMAEQADVADRGAVDAALDGVRARFGPVTVLVTSAAVSGFVPLEEISGDLWARTLAVNLTGTFNCVQAAIGDMVAAGWGRIVTISSAAGQAGAQRQAHYAASKGGVIAFTKAVALDYAASGITANTVPPFVADTPMLRGAQQSGYLPPEKALARMVPAGRLGTGDDVAALVAFLCTDAAGYITGQVIGVNGGAVT
jgi:NAD(P)-dependent dehydrogenase (short-subunit alcohol dehydrogenase family)